MLSLWKKFHTPDCLRLDSLNRHMRFGEVWKKSIIIEIIMFSVAIVCSPELRFLYLACWYIWWICAVANNQIRWLFLEMVFLSSFLLYCLYVHVHTSNRILIFLCLLFHCIVGIHRNAKPVKYVFELNTFSSLHSSISTFILNVLMVIFHLSFYIFSISMRFAWCLLFLTFQMKEK